MSSTVMLPYHLIFRRVDERVSERSIWVGGVWQLNIVENDMSSGVSLPNGTLRQLTFPSPHFRKCNKY